MTDDDQPAVLELDGRSEVGDDAGSVAESVPGSVPESVPESVIDRRNLFRCASLVAAAALPACSKRDEPRPAAAKPTEAAKPVPGPPAPPPAAAVTGESAPGVELVELSIADLQLRLKAGSDTAKSLVAKYRQRIEAIDAKGPKLRSVLELNPEADAIADKLDAERAAGKLRGPLHGIPMLIKDNIDTADQMTTTAGSLALEGSRAEADAFVVAKLREAGAVILGKTNLSEWANFRGMASSSGWSGRGGQTRNPYALDRSPSGSSSGSGVAVAASLCGAAIGSETDGSIVSPSSCNGLVGIKPTVGLVSRAGVVPLSISQDTLGPMARTVADAAAILTAIAGPDPNDPATTTPHKLRPAQPEDYTKYLDPKALTGARLGVPRKGFFGISRGVDALMVDAIAKLKDLGAIIIDPTELPAPPELGPAELEVLSTEMGVYLTKYLAARGRDAHVHSLAEAVAFNKQHADRELPIFGQEYFEQAVPKTSLTEKTYVAARAKCLQIAREQLIDKVMAEHKLDAFIAATNGPAWLIDPVNGDSGSGVSCSTLPAVSGYAHVTVPGGQFRGLPVGLSFFAGPYSEPKLISLAYAYEQATKHRRPPRFLPTIEVA